MDLIEEKIQVLTDAAKSLAEVVMNGNDIIC